ncbi:hypothetical protein E4T56_gene11556 [Termitomyces sp. T112]|nr:hypothetical protein E4T56_gene11556 [Termitomyces sp. T112]
MSLAAWCEFPLLSHDTYMTSPLDTATYATRNTRYQRPDLVRPVKDKKTQEALFGPNIGVVSSGPAWAAGSEKRVLSDELTPDVVTNWVEKSKDVSQPTTTLQALVNLKRPTLRLSPLTSEDSTPDHHHHGLEFEFDCDAPRCGIYVHVLLPKDHPDAPATASSSGLSRFLVFDTVVDGGFGKFLKLEEGALLELGRFEHTPASASASSGDPSSTGDHSTTDHPGTPSTRPHSHRRFGHNPFRKHIQSHSVSGPALRVLDPDPNAAADKVKDDSLEGVRVTIRLAALDTQGTELASPNEQVTYLHVVRYGARPENETGDEDTRPWVVKVAKREATIGPHTFHLHEIYGLTSPSTAPHAPTHSPEHTYPPLSTPFNLNTMPLPAGTEDEMQSECLVCLSSPREVVLLPCRHLVACKDCALNMVEFGAGGNINQATEGEAEAAADPPATTTNSPTEPTAEGDAAPAAPAPASTTPATPTATPGASVSTPGAPVSTPGAHVSSPGAPASAPGTVGANARRKRKAKGWFCPVCRQPYTSLLRITTQPPPTQERLRQEAAALEDAAAIENTNNVAASPPENGSSGGLLNLRPTFFRGFNIRGAPPPSDIESQAATTRVGA